MIKNYPVIYHNENILVVDKEIKVGDKIWNEYHKDIFTVYGSNTNAYWTLTPQGEWMCNKVENLSSVGPLYSSVRKQGSWKIIASSFPIEGIPIIKMEEDIAKLAQERFPVATDERYKGTDFRALQIGYVEGYKAAKSKQCTEEDIRKAFREGVMCGEEKYSKSKNGNERFYIRKKAENEYIASLQKKIVSVDLEMNEKAYCEGCRRAGLMNCGYFNECGGWVMKWFPVRTDDEKVIVKEVYYE